MKKLFLLYVLSLIMGLGLTFSSCSNDDDFVSNNETVLVDEEGYFVYDLELDCSTPDFENEGTTRALSYTWDDNATIYVRFKDGTSYIPGTATYNKASNKWTVRASSSLNITSEATCILFYFENAGSVTSEKVNMTEHTSCYFSYSATYKHPTASSISITATLSPYTWRMRFKGTNGTQIKLPGTENGINYYTSFNRKNGTFTHEKKDITLSVSGGYTPYIYGEFDSFFDSSVTDNPITLINNTYPNYKFSRTLKNSDLRYGTSGYFNIPTSSSYSGWERTEVQPQGALIYKEPYIAWGASKSQTKNYMSGYSLFEEEDNRLVYYGKYLELMTIYDFESSKLVTSTVVIETSATTKAKIDKQLKDNSYSYVSESSGTSLYLSPDGKTIVLMWENTDVSAYYVQYVDYEWFMDDNTTDVLFEEPYIVWGAARSTVKSAVSNRGYTLLAESDLASDDYYLAYNGKYQEDYSLYSFDSSKKLDQVNVIFTSGVTVDNLRSYLSSGLSYTYRGSNSAQNQFFYLSPDANSYAIALSGTFSSGTNYTSVAFVSYSSVSSGAPRMERQSIGNHPEVFDTFKWNVEKASSAVKKRTLLEERLHHAKRVIKL